WLRFDDDERAALAGHDYPRLFELGAHPFLTLTLFIAMFERDYDEPLGSQLAYARELSHTTLPHPDIATRRARRRDTRVRRTAGGRRTRRARTRRRRGPRGGRRRADHAARPAVRDRDVLLREARDAVRAGRPGRGHRRRPDGVVPDPRRDGARRRQHGRDRRRPG